MSDMVKCVVVMYRDHEEGGNAAEAYRLVPIEIPAIRRDNLSGYVNEHFAAPGLHIRACMEDKETEAVLALLAAHRRQAPASSENVIPCVAVVHDGRPPRNRSKAYRMEEFEVPRDQPEDIFDHASFNFVVGDDKHVRACIEEEALPILMHLLEASMKIAA